MLAGVQEEIRRAEKEGHSQDAFRLLFKHLVQRDDTGWIGALHHWLFELGEQVLLILHIDVSTFDDSYQRIPYNKHMRM